MFLYQILSIKRCVEGAIIVVNLTNLMILYHNDSSLNLALKGWESALELVAKSFFYIK